MGTMNRRRRQSGGDPCNCLRSLIRIWGITTAIVVCGVGVDITVHGYTAGIYILIASSIVLFLEIKWVLTLFIQLLCSTSMGNDGDGVSNWCVECWTMCRIAGGWRLAPIYFVMGCALIQWPHHLWLSTVAGGQLIILAMLRLATVLRFCGGGGRYSKEEELLPQYDEDSYCEKTDNQTETIDNGVTVTCRTYDGSDDQQSVEDV